jgi:hypothetical protein
MRKYDVLFSTIEAQRNGTFRHSPLSTLPTMFSSVHRVSIWCENNIWQFINFHQTVIIIFVFIHHPENVDVYLYFSLPQTYYCHCRPDILLTTSTVHCRTSLDDWYDDVTNHVHEQQNTASGNNNTIHEYTT